MKSKTQNNLMEQMEKQIIRPNFMDKIGDIAKYLGFNFPVGLGLARLLTLVTGQVSLLKKITTSVFTAILATFLVMEVGQMPVMASDHGGTYQNQNQDASTYQSREHNYRAVVVADGIEQPWSMVFLPDNSMLVAEKSGNILRVQQNGEKDNVGRIEDAVIRGQGGLMDLTLHPDFATNSLVYYSYTARDGRMFGTRIGRFTWQNGRVANQEEIFRADNLARSERHFGSRIVFDDEGYMFLCLGDRASADQSQNLANHHGTVLRLDDEGNPASDNPFSQNPPVFSYGHRNPQGFIFARGKLWMHEHGARGGDELNLVEAGNNYGWPVISYGRHYSGLKIGEGTAKEGMEQPLTYWDPSIAPSGMIMYQGDMFPNWQGDIFIGALKGEHLRRVDMQGDRVVGESNQDKQGEEVLLEDIGRVREVAEDEDGYIYILLDDSNAQLIRLEPVG